MLTNLIENRGKDFLNLVKMGDYLGRSLRENVELFNVESGRVTYLTESGYLINGSYSFKPNLKLSNIKLDKAEILEDKKAFDSLVNTKVASLLSHLVENDYQEADTSFDEILSVFETKLSYNRIKERLQNKSQRFGDSNKIISSEEFQKVNEIKDNLISFLKENKNLVNIPEIKNGLKLALVVSRAFNLPKITFDNLKESKVYEVKLLEEGNIYDHLCKQELVAKEILEAKENFDSTWANNDLISDLAALIYGKDEQIEEKLSEIVTKIPYFAIATKKQLNTLIQNAINLNELDVSNKDLTLFIQKIYEMKKPVKSYILNLLNEKYGVNINHLNEVPTFSNLLKTEAVIISSLARLSPKNSLIKQVLNDFAKSLDEKNGVEAIDVTDFLNEVFLKAGYKSALNETSLMQYFDFNQVADDLSKIGTVLKLLRPMMGGAGTNPATPTPPITDPLANPMAPGDANVAANPNANPAIQAAEEVKAEDGLNNDPTNSAELPQDDGTGGIVDAGNSGGEVSPVNIVGGNDIANMVSQIEDLLTSLKGSTGDPSVDQPIPGQEEEELDVSDDNVVDDSQGEAEVEPDKGNTDGKDKQFPKKKKEEGSVSKEKKKLPVKK